MQGGNDLTWLVVAFTNADDELSDVYRVPDVTTTEVRELGFGMDDRDPLFDSYPLDTRERLSWAAERLGIRPDTRNHSYFVERATARASQSMIGWEGK
jgi:hypothetical protein